MQPRYLMRIHGGTILIERATRFNRALYVLRQETNSIVAAYAFLTALVIASAGISDEMGHSGLALGSRIAFWTLGALMCLAYLIAHVRRASGVAIKRPETADLFDLVQIAADGPYADSVAFVLLEHELHGTPETLASVRRVRSEVLAAYDDMADAQLQAESPEEHSHAAAVSHMLEWSR